MKHHLSTMSPEEARFREDVEAVFEEAGGPLSEDELIERVWHRELQRAVDSLVEDGLLMEIEEGHYFPTKKGLERLARTR